MSTSTSRPVSRSREFGSELGTMSEENDVFLPAKANVAPIGKHGLNNNNSRTRTTAPPPAALTDSSNNVRKGLGLGLRTQSESQSQSQHSQFKKPAPPPPFLTSNIGISMKKPVKSISTLPTKTKDQNKKIRSLSAPSASAPALKLKIQPEKVFKTFLNFNLDDYPAPEMTRDISQIQEYLDFDFFPGNLSTDEEDSNDDVVQELVLEENLLLNAQDDEEDNYPEIEKLPIGYGAKYLDDYDFFDFPQIVYEIDGPTVSEPPMLEEFGLGPISFEVGRDDLFGSPAED